MAETLINTNQNQLNNQNGSYVELIKNTETAKQDLAEALVNKGVNVSSSSTFEELVNATNNLGTFSNFNIITGNVVNNSNNTISPYTYANTYRRSIIKTSKGMYCYTLAYNNFTIIAIDPAFYSSASSVLFVNFTVNNVGNYGGGFYINQSGTKLWFLGSDKQSIYEYDIDYTNVTNSDALNITVTLNQTMTLASATNSYVSLIAVNEAEKKIIFDGITSESAIGVRNCFYADYSNGITNLTTTACSVKGARANSSSGGSSYSPHCLDNEHIVVREFDAYEEPYYFNSLFKVDWTDCSISLVKTLYAGNEMSGYAPVIITYNNRKVLPYVVMYRFNNVQKQQLHLLFLDDYSEQIFDNISGFTKDYKYSDKYVFCLPEFYNDDLYLSGGILGSYYKLSIENNKIKATFTPSLSYPVLTGSQPYWYLTVCSALIIFSQNKIMILNSINNTSKSTIYTLYPNKIIAYIYENPTPIQSFIPQNIGDASSILLDVPQSETLVEDN